MALFRALPHRADTSFIHTALFPIGKVFGHSTGRKSSACYLHRTLLKASLRTAVLVSGGGRSLENLCERLRNDNLRGIDIACVIASKRSAFALERAKNFEVPSHVVSPKDCGRRSDDFSDAITKLLEHYRVELVVLAGFMHFYRIPDQYKHKVINIHPSLIPSFCGKGFYGHHVHQAVVRTALRLVSNLGNTARIEKALESGEEKSTLSISQ